VKKKTSPTQPKTRHTTILRQLVELIPTHVVAKFARKHDIDARTFSAWSHVVTLLYAQLACALSLNDVCDALRLWRTPLRAVRGATPPSRNNLSNANKTRDPGMARDLFWAVLAHLEHVPTGFGRARPGHAKGPHLAHRFRRTINIIDATVIQLVADCLDWAKHRRRKAGVKVHLRLTHRSLLPACVVISPANENEQRHLPALCAHLRAGEIALFDRGYYEFAQFQALTDRGIFYVTRAREGLVYHVVKNLPRPKNPRILNDQLIVLTACAARRDHPDRLRRVVAIVEVDGQDREMVFITNNFDWSAASVAELYRCRWDIEVFFKQIKQTLQIADFLGHNANAVHWQLWMALLTYVLLRCQAWRADWAHSFSRLLTLLRVALWQVRDIRALLRSCGTASGDYRYGERPRQMELAGLTA
jgi:Transposase DDE domain/Domain of unknown function (DUF4372)